MAKRVLFEMDYGKILTGKSSGEGLRIEGDEKSVTVVYSEPSPPSTTTEPKISYVANVDSISAESALFSKAYVDSLAKAVIKENIVPNLIKESSQLEPDIVKRSYTAAAVLYTADHNPSYESNTRLALEKRVAKSIAKATSTGPVVVSGTSDVIKIKNYNFKQPPYLIMTYAGGTGELLNASLKTNKGETASKSYIISEVDPHTKKTKTRVSTSVPKEEGKNDNVLLTGLADLKKTLNEYSKFFNESHRNIRDGEYSGKLSPLALVINTPGEPHDDYINYLVPLYYYDSKAKPEVDYTALFELSGSSKYRGNFSVSDAYLASTGYGSTLSQVTVEGDNITIPRSEFKGGSNVVAKWSTIKSVQETFKKDLLKTLESYPSKAIAEARATHSVTGDEIKKYLDDWAKEYKEAINNLAKVNGKGLEAAHIALRQHKNLTFERTIVYRSKVKSKSLLDGVFGPLIGDNKRYTIVDSPRTSITEPSVVILPQDPNSVFSLDKMEVLVEEKVTIELSPMNVIALSNYASNKGSQKIIKRLQRIVKGEATIVGRPDVKDSICVYLKNLGPTTGKYYTTEVSHKVSPDGGYLTSLSVIRAGNAVTMVTSEAEEEASSQKQQFVNGIAKKAGAIVPKYNANRTKLYNALEDLYKKGTITSGTSVMGTVQPDGSYSYISSPSGTSSWVRPDWRAPMKAAEVDEKGNPLPLDNNSKQQ
ncbi:MAG TPA: hypothetical protein PLG47_00405 [Candidatus Dojkabacteria bacterium]|nr:hypothetical protein [Candidatus Dojkabacteria bacterium]